MKGHKYVEHTSKDVCKLANSTANSCSASTLLNENLPIHSVQTNARICVRITRKVEQMTIPPIQERERTHCLSPKTKIDILHHVNST